MSDVTPAEVLSVAVVGVGALGRHHVRLLKGLPGVKLTAIAEPNEAVGQHVAREYGINWVRDYRELLTGHDIDAVSIVVPTTHHFGIAGDFLRHGIPVFVEKPITTTLEQAQQLCQLADEQKLPLQVGHVERFNPAFRELGRRIAPPRYIRAERLSPYSFRSIDVSVVHDLMIHDIDLLLNLTQARINRVEAFGVCVFGGHADIVQARLTLDNGCLADLTASRVNPEVRRTFQAWSETGCWTADLQQQTVSGITPGPALLDGQLPWALANADPSSVPELKSELFTRFLSPLQPEVERRNALEDELQSFVDVVRTKGEPLVDGRAGLAALEVAEQIVDAVNQHRWDATPQGRVGPHAHPLVKRSAA